MGPQVHETLAAQCDSNYKSPYKIKRFLVFLFSLAVCLLTNALAQTAAGDLEISGPRPWIDVTAPNCGSSATLCGADPAGVNPSATAISNALGVCGGGTVFLPPGTYKQDMVITANSPCTLLGLGPLGGVHIVKSVSTTSSFPSNNGSFVITSSQFTLKNIEYDGNNGSFSGPCITVTSPSATPPQISDIVIEDNYIRRSRRQAMSSRSPCREPSPLRSSQGSRLLFARTPQSQQWPVSHPPVPPTVRQPSSTRITPEPRRRFLISVPLLDFLARLCAAVLLSPQCTTE